MGGGKGGWTPNTYAFQVRHCGKIYMIGTDRSPATVGCGSLGTHKYVGRFKPIKAATVLCMNNVALININFTRMVGEWYHVHVS